MALLKVDAITSNTETGRIINAVSFSQRHNEKIAVVGETGSGKTTLLKIIAGLIQPDKGKVIFDGEQVRGPDETLVPGHPSIAYLSQDFELPKFLRVSQVLEYANRFEKQDADTLFEICEITHLQNRKTDSLSGGERQRIALARLLVGSPKLLLLDEPFSHLDVLHRNVLKNVVDSLSSRLKITIILVSHEADDVLPWASKVIVLKDGAVVQRGTPEEVYLKPHNEYVAGLFGKYSILERGHTKGRRNSRTRNRRFFVRPEQISISKSKTDLAGIVTRSSFMGSHYEIDVLCEKGTFVVRNAGPARAGKKVYLELTARRPWHIDP